MTQLSGQWKRKHRGVTLQSQVRTFSVSFHEITNQNIQTSIKLLRYESKKAQVRIHNQSLGSWAVLIWLSLVFFYSTLGPCDGENALFARKDKTLDRILSMQSSTGFYQKPRESTQAEG